MRILDFSNCNHFDVDLKLNQIIPICRKLVSLNFCECIQISDETLIGLSPYCGNLVYLNIRGCKKVTDLGIEAICTYCPYIESLDLSNCHGDTDKSITSITETCPNLKAINPSYCPRIKDDSIIKLTEKCPLIETIYLSFIGDKSFVEVMKSYGHQLKHLTLIMCNKLSYASLDLIPYMCSNLVTLCISYCAEANEGLLIHSIYKCCPKLIIFELIGLRSILPYIIDAVQLKIKKRGDRLPRSDIREAE